MLKLVFPAKYSAGFVIGAAIACAVISMLFLILNRFIDDGSSYRALNPVTRTKFATEYKLAREQGSAWAKDPKEVALRFVTAGRTECLDPTLERVMIQGGEAIINIYDACSDDSVRATRYRLELGQTGDFWEVKGAGWKHLCARDGPLGFLRVGQQNYVRSISKNAMNMSHNVGLGVRV